MNVAAAFFEEQLRSHPQKEYAVDELARRGLAPDAPAVQAFRVGYAPPAWDGLAAFLKKQGISPAVGESVGLLVPRSSSGYYDRFRHRLMFAVIDSHGRVVAFSGRALKDIPAARGTRSATLRRSTSTRRRARSTRRARTSSACGRRATRFARRRRRSSSRGTSTSSASTRAASRTWSRRSGRPSRRTRRSCFAATQRR